MTLTTDSFIADLKLDSLTNRRLTEKNIKTLGNITRHSRRYIAAIVNPFGSNDELMAELDEKLADADLAYASEAGQWNICTSCPTCQTCGNPRAVDARQVVVNLAGRATHVGPNGSVCQDCDEYHRGLVADRARELTGRLV